MDIVICILPKIEPRAPSVGPSILKSHCIAAGFSCKVIDFNIELYNSIPTDMQSIWHSNDSVFDNMHEWLPLYANTFKSKFEQFADRLIAENSTWIGLSVFSTKSMLPAIEMIKLIKYKNPKQKIVVGGAGIYNDIHTLTAAGADHWIVGDAEESIIELLKGNMSFKGIDNTQPYQIDDLDSASIPDYDDIDFSQYTESDVRQVYITASRGCIRDCTFCDVASMWPKFRFRSSANVVEEIIQLRQRYGIENFYFTDSLINGGVKIFRDMCAALARYRQETGDHWTLGSQFICRSAEQMPPNDYDLMKAAGFSWVAIGIESASQAVRDHMRKGFNNEDMWYTFDQLHRVGINLNILLIAGYLTETKADFDETLEMIHRLSRDEYLSNVDAINVFEAIIFKKTPSYDISKQLGVIDIDNDTWHLPDNTNNLRVRVIRTLKAYTLIEHYRGDDKMFWLAKSVIHSCITRYKEITGRDLPDDILNYDESLEYN